MARKQFEPGVADARLFLDSFGCQPADWTAELSDLAIAAHFRFGKGRHPARLNFGDCMSYALAKSLDVPLLYKGEGFAMTDV